MKRERVATRAAMTMSIRSSSGGTVATEDAPDGRAIRAALCVLAAGCALALIRVLLTVPLRVPLNYNEGWNAYHVAEVLRGSALYHSSSPFFFNNYPPLSFYIVAACTRAIADPIIAARYLSLAAFVIWTILLAETAVLLHCSRQEGWFAALLFAAVELRFTDYVGIADPQMLGHAVASAGLVTVLRRPHSMWFLLAGATLLTTAAFIKQNLIALPIACVVWLAMTDRPQAWRLAALGSTIAALGLVLCFAVFGSAFLEVFIAPRSYVPLKGAWMALQWVIRMIAFLVLFTVVARRCARDQAVIFCGVYATVGTLFGFLFGGGAGVNWNVFFDADWALCLSAAVALNRLSSVEQEFRAVNVRAKFLVGYVMALTIALVVAVRMEWWSPRYWLTPHAVEAASAALEIEFLEAHGERALCEELALCFWARKAVEVDVFNTQQGVLTGRIDEGRLLGLMDGHAYGVIQIDAPARDLGRPFSLALAREYRLDHDALNRRYFVPR